ncbi:MAG TPA: carbohydrate kinase family protein [Roseiflexaceae bacterium]|nr:carbohydrate kinase family protein [Roseiflexaceae bacterium]
MRGKAMVSLQVEAIVAGHLCLDVIPALARGACFVPGRTIEAGPVTLATGGAVSNTGVALHRLGVAVRLVGRVGPDLYGRVVRDIIESYGPGLADGLITAPGESSAYTIILSPPGADRMFIHHPGSNATFGADDVAPELLERARLLHFGYPPIMARMRRAGGQELVTLLRRAKEAGLTTSLDWTMIDPAGPAGRIDWQAVLAVALPYVDVFIPNIEELLMVLDRPSFDRLTAEAGEGAFVDRVPPELLQLVGAEMLGLGAAVVGLKAGHRGLYLRTAGAERLAALGRAAPANLDAWAGRELWAPCFAAELVGTTGAGDATIAGFLMGLLRGFAPEQALAAANAVGACSVEAADALGGVRSWSETAARLEAGWPRLPLEVESPGWCWDETLHIWIGPEDRG